jgi:outer membrane protein assembly factor BamB
MGIFAGLNIGPMIKTLNRKMDIRFILFAACLLVLPLSLIAQNPPASAEWSQWRGPDRSGTWYGGPQVGTLSDDVVEFLWEAPVGPGYSGPTVSGGKVYVTDYVDGQERVLCMDVRDGSEIWSYDYPVTYNVGYPTGPRASVLIADGRAYSWGTMGHLHCFDAQEGRLLWAINSAEKFQSRIPTWGLASNPIIAAGHLVVQVGGADGACMVAFDPETGAERWRALDDEASYAAPVLIDQAGEEVLVCWTGESITGLDPGSGRIFWTLPFEPRNMIMNISDPVYDPPYLFLSAFFDGSYLVELDQGKLSARLVYHRHGKNERETDALHSCMSTPVIRDGFIYGIDSYGEARCLELTTGERVWEDLTLVAPGRWANVHLVQQGELTWGFNETGELLLGHFSPAGYKDLGRVKVIDPVRISPNPRNGVCWAHPAFSGDRVFFRSDEKLVCVRIGGPVESVTGVGDAPPGD